MKKHNRSSNTGRSMLEMLGTLAIIGILSIGAVAGLRLAFDSHKANVLLEDVRLMAATILQTEDFWSENAESNRIDGATISTDEFIQTTPYPMSAILENTSTQGFSIQAEDVEKGVCRSVLNKAQEAYEIRVNDVLNGECSDENTLNFIFLGDFEDRPDDCEHVWCAGVCCDAGEICVNNQCVGKDECNYATENPCGNGCCPKGFPCCGDITCCESPTALCYGDGLSQCCSNPLILNSDGKCVCPDIMTLNSEGKCVCPNSLILNSDGKCVCPKPGYIYVDDKCQKMVCEGGPEKYECRINDLFCGGDCTSEGRNCTYGICREEDCPSGEKFSSIDYDAQYKYGCEKEYSEDVVCYNIGHAYKCYKDEKSCMDLDASFELLNGTCDEKICQKISSDAEWTLWGSDANTYRGACLFKEGNLLCYPKANDVWNCYQNGFLCGISCKDPLNCGDCNTEFCPNGLTYNSEKGRCEAGTYYCTTTNGSYYQTCYMIDDDTRCALYNVRQKQFAVGSCENPGCPNDMTFGYVAAQDVWGCIKKEVADNGVNPGIMSCINQTDYSPAACYFNGEKCGYYCDYDGRNCKSVFLPQCAKEGYCPQTGYDMSEGCTCEGTVTSSNGKQYCCPSGHSYLNGGCTLTKCPDSEPYYSNGACVESCPNFVSDGMCVDTCPDGQTADDDNVCVEA